MTSERLVIFDTTLSTVPLTRQPLCVCRPLPQAGEVRHAVTSPACGRGRTMHRIVRVRASCHVSLSTPRHFELPNDMNRLRKTEGILSNGANSASYCADANRIVHHSRHRRRTGTPSQTPAGEEKANQNNAKIDEQFCCRSARRGADRKPQRLALRWALPSVSCSSPARAKLDRERRCVFAADGGSRQVGIAP